jgi:GLPGLI family protein
MKIFKIVLVLMSSLMFGQTYRVIYELKYKTDSLKDQYSSQNMVLDISEHETKFYYEKLLKFDSLSRKGINISFSMPLQQILKKAKGGKMYTNYYSVDGQYFQYNTLDEVKWEISKENKIENNNQLQKAKTFFGGRYWEAWFSNDTPLQEGPYKFKGLPGLIYEIRDSKNNFIYQFISLTKLTDVSDTSNIVESCLGIKPITVTEKQFKKILLDKYLNPFSQFDNMNEGNFGFQYGDKYITTKKELSDIKSSYQKNIRDHYNPIELDKAIPYR